MSAKIKFSTFVFFFILITTCFMMASFSRSMDIRSQAAGIDISGVDKKYLLPTSIPKPTIAPNTNCTTIGSITDPNNCSNCSRGFYSTGEWVYKCK
ncbi:hypothetical protein ACFL1A_00355 [Patescibacteria group bacterium]